MRHVYDVTRTDRIAYQADLMRRKAWDIERDIHWNIEIDVTRPLIPLHHVDLMFPGLPAEERLAISQVLGLMCANGFISVEALICNIWESYHEKFEQMFADSPHLIALGDQFILEERKHTELFRRYLHRWLAACGLDVERVTSTLPDISSSWQGRMMFRNASKGGLAAWWIILMAEEQSQHVYRIVQSGRGEVEPLYAHVMQRHFEEEARHIPFPYTACVLLIDRLTGLRSALQRRKDIILAQALFGSFVLMQGRRVRKDMRKAEKEKPHAWSAHVESGMARIRRLPMRQLIDAAFRAHSLLGPMANYRFYPNLVELLKSRRLSSLPFPAVHAE